MEESSATTEFEAKIERVTFSLATRQEICKASISDCPISHVSQLSNPFLGLPLEVGKCESCGTGEPGQCEGHFGYVELPTPIYHPDHVSELKKLLSILCLKCLKIKNRKVASVGIVERVLSTCCEETAQISVNEVRTNDGACYLELKIPSKSRPREGSWTFLDKYGFRYGNTYSRPLLPSEVMAILRKIPQDTRKKLSSKGYYPQDGYIIQHLPVPPNCLSVPDVSDGISSMSSDYSITLLKKVLRQVEIIKNSRSGKPNFVSQEIESNDLQASVAQYLQYRGTGKASRDVDSRFGVKKELNASSTKAWLEKMKTLFIRKGSGFSSRSVITGDSFKGVSEIGLPYEIAQKITFEERVSEHNMQYLQKLVDEKLCLTYKDGTSTYSLKEGSKGHTSLRPGQVVHRRVMDGDIVFINRPPTTHKHSLQALSVYIHDDHTVKINPLICGPLSADFDGDCIHLFYPQSLEAKAEVVELFAVEKQLLSSHTGNFNLQLTNDSLLSLKTIFQKFFLSKAKAQQLAMFAPVALPRPAVVKSKTGALWTASQILQTTLPDSFDCLGERYNISKSELLRIDCDWDVMTAIVNDIVTSLFFLKGPSEVLRFFDSVQPLLMENLFSEGSSVSLRDFFLPGDVLRNIQAKIQDITPLLHHLRDSYSESIALQLDSYLRNLRVPVSHFIKSSAIGRLVDAKSESSLSKVVQQIGFLGIQISDKGKFYTELLVKDMSSLFLKKYPSIYDHPAEEFGLVSRPLFLGLDPYQEMVHSISSREVIVRSSRGLTEPGTLFKNLMAILRDVVICHDGTVRNMCSNSIIQFEYGVNSANIVSEFCAGDPVGVLAATAMSNPAYKAVLDSSPSSNSSWDMMKEILLCGVNFKNDISDRRVILYLNSCDCGRKHCQEKSALIVKNQLKKVSLKDTAIDFLIEYKSYQQMHESNELNTSLVGHIHLNKVQLTQSNISMHEILDKCQDTIIRNQKKKKVGNLFKRVDLSFSDCCAFCASSESKWTDVPCIQFLLQGMTDDLLDRASDILADTISPVLLQTIIKGDPKISTANVVWISLDTSTGIRSPSKSAKGELAIDVILKKEAVKKSEDAWRIIMDSCLPIIHLIDTQRSIPYGIKQVQELLGISAAFEQAVQRLSTSVTMVTKGVLKDHLLLLGNSMTSTGTLIGFNPGGVKKLSNSLTVQVPFMAATLFTPRKCFEKAAEKCHVDNLSSIVASCAWGKHVSVGTGSPFEILWDTRKAELSPQKEIDVYDFLHMVSGSSKLDDMGTGLLGADVEDLDPEDDFMECEMSPERESGQAKPSFDDGEFSMRGDDNNGFAQASKVVSEDSWSVWGKRNEPVGNDSITAWGKKNESAGNDSATAWGKKNEPAGNDSAAAWGKKNEPAGNDSTAAWGSAPKQTNDSKSWGSADKNQKNDIPAWGSAQKQSDDSPAWSSAPKQSNDFRSALKQSNDSPAWGSAPKQSNDPPAWGSVSEKTKNDSPAWGSAPNQSNDSPAWGSAPKQSNDSRSVPKQSNDSPAWGSAPKQSNDSSAWGSAPKQSNDSPAWGSAPKQSNDSPAWGSAPKQSNDSPAWGSAPKQSNDSPAWGSAPKHSNDSPAWGSAPKQSNDPPAWGSAPKQSNDSPAWGSAPKQSNDSPAWGSAPNQSNNSPARSSAAEKQTNDSPAWGSAKVDDSSTKSAWGQSGEKKESTVNNWGAIKKPNDSGSQDLGSPRVEESDEKGAWAQRGRGWGRGRGGGRGRENSRGRGRSNVGEWRNDRSSTPRPAGDSNAPGFFTLTRIRLDSFTAEEQDILSEVESIIKNIRRIMNQTGYTDGDPLPADDQKYIIENIFNYHPDKATKAGAGIDFIMVHRHKEFQDSRCLYAVSVDGVKEDFSYRKCVENLLKQKFPEKAEAFIPKYFFKKPQPPRTGWNRERGPARSEAGTPGPDEVGSPRPNTPGGWNSAGSPRPNTPGGCN